ncbi:MAG: FadR family transcriptional regulator [Clostridiales bacterium]|nr:FadR family transcriptional regulator [Clostridiales bacterium]
MKEALKAIGQTSKILPERAAEQIKALIRENQWEAGDKLPNEFEMARQLSVGRGTIREAVKLLIAQNILEIQRGRGTFVCEKPGVTKDPLGLSFMKDKRKLALDLCEVRLMIEPQIAAKAAAQADEKTVRKLWQLCEAAETLIKSGNDYTQADIALHEMIAGCTGNQVVKQLVPIIQNSIMLFINITNAGLRNYTVEEHRGIIEAISCRDAKKAREIMEIHICRNKDNIEKMTDIIAKER